MAVNYSAGESSFLVPVYLPCILLKLRSGAFVTNEGKAKRLIVGVLLAIVSMTDPICRFCAVCYMSNSTQKAPSKLSYSRTTSKPHDVANSRRRGS